MAKRDKTPAKKDARQVIADVDRLFNSAPMQAYHNAIPDYIALTLGHLAADIPEDFTHGITGEVHSTRVLRVGTAMKSKAAGYPVYTDVYPKAVRTGVPTQSIVKQADRAGRAMTIMRATMDNAMQVTDPTRDWQFYGGWCVWQLHRRKKPGQGWGWELEVCDPRTCAFPELPRGTYRPKRFARRRRQLVSRLKETYPGLSLANGEVRYEALSTARPVQDGPLFTGVSGATGGDEEKDEELELIDYDDGYWLYHVVRNAQGSSDAKDGEIVWSSKNTAYDPDAPEECGAMAVVVPGATFAPGGDGLKMLPVLWSLLQIVNSRNLVNDLRMSTALRGRPGQQIVISKTPQDIEELERIKAIQQTSTPETGDAIVYVTGDQVRAWEVKANEDLDKIDVMLEKQEEQAVSELLVNTSPEVVANSTATSFHLSVGEVDASQTSWLQHPDFAWKEVLTMVGWCMVNDEEEYDFVAPAEMRMTKGQSVAQGEFMSFTAADLDFGWEVGVATRQETEEQKNQRLINMLFKQEKGIVTLEQVIEADTEDVTAQAMKLRKQYAMMIGGPVLHTYFLPKMLEDAVKTGAGVWLNMSEQSSLFTGQQPAAQTPATQPTQSFAPAPTNGAQGALSGAPQ